MRRRQSKNNDDRKGIIDLTSVAAASGPSKHKHKMVPPNVSNCTNFSYEDQVDSNASVSFLGDSADNDAANTLNIRDELPDPEGELLHDSQMADRMDISKRGQGFSNFVEQTHYPESNRLVTKKLI